MAYALGAVKPWVADVANTVGPVLGVTNIAGWRASAADMSGHPAGLALDLQVGSDVNLGNKVAAYFIQNASALQVKYLIWQQRSWYPGKGWKAMATVAGEAPGYDPNHKRHVHVSFNEAVSDGRRLPKPTTGASDATGGLPWWTLPAQGILGSADWVQQILGSGAAVVGGVGSSIVDAATTPVELLSTFVNRGTWVRVAQVVGGAMLIWGGIWVLIASSDAVGKVANVAAIVPTPATRAVGTAVSAVNSATK